VSDPGCGGRVGADRGGPAGSGARNPTGDCAARGSAQRTGVNAIHAISAAPTITTSAYYAVRALSMSMCSGSSPAAEAECGHHAASMSPSRTRARVIRAGRAQRRAPVEPFTIVALQRRQRRRRVDPKTSDIRLVFRRLRPKRHIPARRDGKTGSSCPCGVLTNEEVDRYALLTEGRRSNRALISFIMRLRFAMTARTRFALDCTGSGHGRLHRPISGSRAYKIVVLLC